MEINIVLICLIVINSFKFYSFGIKCEVYDPESETSPDKSHLSRYYLSIDSHCDNKNGQSSHISSGEFINACLKAEPQIERFIINDREYLAKDARGTKFSPKLYHASRYAIFNEFVTKNLVIDQCLSEFEAVIKLPQIESQKCVSNNTFCDLESEVSLYVKCDPNWKYSRIDGKCNNLVNTNWGSNFHCHRRLLPPDYKDGVSEPRAAFDGSALPNGRLISTELMSDIKSLDFHQNSLHMIWGQAIAHDAFKTPQYLSRAINCCPNASIHRECFPITDIPLDKLALAYNQSCINFVRSISCKTCSQGPREQLNMATPLLDLSHIYGGNENDSSNSLRTFERGELLTGEALDGSKIFPKANLPHDQDIFDLSPCNPPIERPWLTCLKTGDGIRGNQNPMTTALSLLFLERHNQHCGGLAKVNPHWTDEQLFYEARRILTAEYAMINYNEYIPSILNEHQMDFYGLRVKNKGFSEYDPEVNPTVFQSVVVAAFRYGHSQVNSLFRVEKEDFFESYTLRLRDKYFEMSDLWDGNHQGIIKGMCQMPTYKIDLNIKNDVHDFLFLNKVRPSIVDLAAINIMRCRDHGVPSYVYYLEYCTRVHIKSWDDLTQFIEFKIVDKMKKIYEDYRDMDLFVGGLAEKHINGSALGPTFGCLLGIQYFHWKFGDRFYFEHSGQPGSFTEDQLDDIRKVASVSNMICKTTDAHSVQRYSLLMPSKDNKMVDCNTFNEIDYNLYVEDPPCSSDNCT